MAGAQRDLAEGLGDADLDRVGRNEIEPLGAVLVSQEIEQVGSELRPRSMPARPSVCRIFSAAPAASSASVMRQSAANQVEHRQVRDRAPVGQAAPLDVGGLLGAHALAELVEQAGLPDPGVPDDADELAPTAEGGEQPAVQHRHLLMAADEARHAPGRAQPRPFAPDEAERGRRLFRPVEGDRARSGARAARRRPGWRGCRRARRPRSDRRARRRLAPSPPGRSGSCAPPGPPGPGPRGWRSGSRAGRRSLRGSARRPAASPSRRAPRAAARPRWAPRRRRRPGRAARAPRRVRRSSGPSRSRSRARARRPRGRRRSPAPRGPRASGRWAVAPSGPWGARGARPARSADPFGGGGGIGRAPLGARASRFTAPAAPSRSPSFSMRARTVLREMLRMAAVREMFQPV